MRHRPAQLGSGRPGLRLIGKPHDTPRDLLMTVDHPDFPARIRRRDPEAIQSVVHMYLTHIFRAALGAGLDTQRAEDVTQATFASFIETAPRFEGRSHVRTWLFGILYRKIFEARREVRRDLQTDDIEEIVERRFDVRGSWMQPPRPVELGVYDAEVRQRIQECLDRLPAQQRMVFILREVEEFGTEEICKILRITRTNSGVVLFRARNRLRECLESKGVKG